ncbi:hypothetical protein, partial [Caulobacter sp. S45]|uniref:hypothetical protein n=1 Tax=Caulobacter sp. S45 TaxID=1641861 RepID=UPI0035302662
MSSTAASPPSRTATPFAAAQAARRRLEADSGFHTLVDEKTSDQVGAGGPGAAKPTSPAAKSRPASPPNSDATSKGAAPAAGAAVPTGASALQQPPEALIALPLPSDTATPAETQAAIAVQGEGAAQSPTAVPPAVLKPRLGASSAAQPTPDDLAEADEEAGGTGESLPGGAPAGSEASRPAGTSSGSPRAPAPAAGSAAQPLMAALSGTGATLVKAQAGPGGAGPRTAA